MQNPFELEVDDQLYAEIAILCQIPDQEGIWKWSDVQVCVEEELEFYTLRFAGYGFVIHLSNSGEFPEECYACIEGFKGFLHQLDINYLVNRYPGEDLSRWFTDREEALRWIYTWMDRIYRDHETEINKQLLVVERLQKSA
jgi:hypothetical protein